MAQGAGKDVFEVILKLYIALIFVVLVCSLGNRPQVGFFLKCMLSYPANVGYE